MCNPENKIIDKLYEFLKSLQDDHRRIAGWQWCFRDYGIVEFNQYTPADEDYSFEAFGCNTPDELVECVYKQQELFDLEEHAIEQYRYRQHDKENVTLQEMLDDAKAIKEMMLNLYKALLQGAKNAQNQ